MPFLRFITPLFGLLALGAGACSDGPKINVGGDASFGTVAPQLDRDAQGEAGDEDGLGGDGTGSEQVRLRIFSGVLNLAGARFCHDPDYQVDDPATDEDEGERGPQPPRPLLVEELDGGAVLLGTDTGYITLRQGLTEGAITVHRAALVADAGADGGLLNVLMDAGLDAGEGALDPCDPSSQEAVLPLPVTASWLEPPRPLGDAGAAGDASVLFAPLPDAGPNAPERRGFVTTLSGDAPLTLFGSGRSLDPKELALRKTQARDEYLRRNPGDTTGAEAAARAQGAWLESALGPRFLLSRAQLPGVFTFALSFVHLIPDIAPSIDGGVSAEIGSGALHMCVRIDTGESDLPNGVGSHLEFRNVASLGRFAARSSYRFRLFVEADFVRTQAGCGSTSLRPVAEIEILPDSNTFEAGHSYTLVAWGARSSSDLCTAAYQSDGVARPGCARPADTLTARMIVLENELPEPP